MTTCFVGLGANLADPVAQLDSAREAMAASAAIRVSACSRYYRSRPLGPAGQPDYVNAVLALETNLEPHALLHWLQALEAAHGRARRGERWGPRTLDLDLLLYGDRIIATPDLTVPHPGLSQREFVLHPLREVAPAGLVVPGLGPLTELVARCPLRGLTVLEEV